MDLHIEALPGAPDHVALLYGPIVLAGRLGTDDVPSPFAREQTAYVLRLETYALPSELRRGRDTITITFRAADRWAAATANVFGCGVSRTH